MPMELSATDRGQEPQVLGEGLSTLRLRIKEDTLQEVTVEVGL